ncbi:S-layer homology domain-containing protein [Paenibacillus sp. F411]|uniref:CBM35 domain-containing protein n=1 Tax=Paenibacillus sp. F411 TaxID=2820239 RepID=UPI001AAE493F|nr:CBM35 domain-containing protein [Paenibacillus sp. F411]MBO2944390.1 S-layer homology domain-containing protein [Paenibacillus sp. F411]
MKRTFTRIISMLLVCFQLASLFVPVEGQANAAPGAAESAEQAEWSPLVTNSEAEREVNRYESEEAMLKDVTATSSTSGFSGTGYVEMGASTAQDASMSFTVNATESGDHQLTIGYYLNVASAQTKNIRVTVNEGTAFSVKLGPSSKEWTTQQITVSLTRGKNTIKLSKEQAYILIDYMELAVDPAKLITMEPVEDQEVSPGETLQLSLPGAGPEPQELLYSCDSLPQGAALDAVTGVLTWTPGADAIGTYPLSCKVTDGVFEASRSFIVRVVEPGVKLKQIARKYEAEGAKLRGFNLAVETALSGYSGAGYVGHFDDISDQLVFETYASESKVYDVKLRYQVQAGSSKKLDLYVNGVKQSAVTFAPPRDQWQNAVVSLSLQKGHNELVLAKNQSWLKIDYVEYDDYAPVDAETKLPLPEPQKPSGPVLQPLTLKAAVAGEPVAFQVEAADPNGDVMTFSMSELPEGAMFDPVSREFQWVPTASQIGTYTPVVSVTDGVYTAQDRVTVAVLEEGYSLQPIQRRYEAESASKQGGVVTEARAEGYSGSGYITGFLNTEDAIDFDIYVSYKGTYDVTFAYQLYGADSNKVQDVVVNGKQTYVKTFLLGEPGRWVTDTRKLELNQGYNSLQIRKNGGSIHLDYIELTDLALHQNDEPVPLPKLNKPPILEQIGLQRVKAGSTLSFTMKATDGNSDPIRYRAEQLPEGAQLNETTGAFTWTPGAQADSWNKITLIATDGESEAREEVVLLLTKPTDQQGAPRLKLDGKSILAPDGTPLTLRGYNWGWWDQNLAEDAVLLKEMGGNFVRLNFRWNFGDSTHPWNARKDDEPGHINPVHLAQLDQYIEWLSSNGIWIDLFVNTTTHYDDLLNDPETREKFMTMWTFLAERYKDQPYMASYEIHAEPQPTVLQHEEVVRLYKETIDRIMQVDTDTPFVIGPAKFYNAENLIDTYYLKGYPIIYAFNHFDPHEFTHAEKSPLLEYPNAGKGWDKAFLSKRLEVPLSFRDKFNVPIYCDQVGAKNTAPGYLQWHDDVLSLLNEESIPWTVWNFRQGSGRFGLYETNPATGTYERNDELYQRLLPYFKAAQPPQPQPLDPAPVQPDGTPGQSAVVPLPSPSAELQRGRDGAVTLKLKELQTKTDNGLSMKVLSVNSELLRAAFQQAPAQLDGAKRVTLDAASLPADAALELSLPPEALQLGKEQIMEVKTSFGVVALPGHMLAKNQLRKEQQLALRAVPLLAKNGKPGVELDLIVDGKVLEWDGEDALVHVALPYTLQRGEKSEFITVHHIHDDGMAHPVVNGGYDEVSGMVTFRVNHFSAYKVVYVDKSFQDMESHWARHAVSVLASKGIIQGRTANVYGPEALMTRGDFVTLLVRTLELNAPASSWVPFTDVEASDDYAREVMTARALGITSGVGNHRFAPREAVTRQDMMVMTAAALQLKPGWVQAQDPDSSVKSWSDAADISSYALESVNKLSQAGLIQGADGRLQPKAPTTRAEMAALLYRLYNQIVR